MDYGRVEITNHIFHYDVKLSSRDNERITYLYDTETEKRRSKTEVIVRENIKNTLDKVLESITKKIEGPGGRSPKKILRSRTVRIAAGETLFLICTNRPDGAAFRD